MSRTSDDLEALDSPDEGQNLIFLISQPRAGATALQRVLGKHDEIHSVAEPSVMLHPVYALKEEGIETRFDAQASANSLRGFIAGLSGGEQNFIDAVRAYALTLYNKALLWSRKTYFLDMTPRYYMVYDDLRKVFPRARFIIFVRNPFGVLASNLRTLVGLDPDKLKNRKEDLLLAPQRLSEAAQAGDPNVSVVRYEEMIAEPSAAMEWIYGFLGLRAPEDLDARDLHAGEPGRKSVRARSVEAPAESAKLEDAKRMPLVEPVNAESVRRRKAEDEWDVGEEVPATIVPGVQLGGAAAIRAEKESIRAQKVAAREAGASNEAQSDAASESAASDTGLFDGSPGFARKKEASLVSVPNVRDEWEDLLERDPQFWRLAAEYLEKLGRPVVERLGYSYDDLEQALADTRPDDRALMSTRGLPW